MSDRAGISKEYKKDFCLDEGLLRKIHDVFRKFAEKLSERPSLSLFVLKSDDSYYETSNIDEVLEDENSVEKAITGLSIRLKKPRESEVASSSEKDRGIALVRFRPNSEDKVTFDIEEKERDWCYLFADELETQIKRSLIKNRLRFLTGKRSDAIAGLALMGAALTIAMGAVSKLPNYSLDAIKQMTTEQQIFKLLELTTQYKPNYGLFFPILILSMFSFLAIVEIRPLSRLFGKLCRSVFYWGDMKAEYDKYRNLKRNLGWIVLVGLIIALVGGIILRYI